MARQIADIVDIPTAGTAIQIKATPTHHVLAYILRAASGNTGNIFLGGSDVSSSNGFPLGPGEFVTWGVGFAQSDVGKLHTILLSSLWFDTATNGNDVAFVAVVTGE